MIDSHNEYKHGLASDMRRKHLPPSASLDGWDFRPMDNETSLRPWFIAGLCVVIFVGLCMIASVR